MAEQYPMNTTFKKLADASFKLGQNLNKQRDVSGQDVGRFAGVAETVSGAGQSGQTDTPSSTMPADLASLGTVTTPYGGSTRYEPGGQHLGIDIANKIGTPIPALVGGTVVESRTGQSYSPNKPSFGNYITIKASDGKMWRYSHLQDSYVPIGSEVKVGQKIGNMGISGSVYSVNNPNNPEAASHLDLRVYDTASKIAGAAKRYYNPAEYLKSFK